MIVYVNSGNVIPYTPDEDVTAGDVVVQGGMICVVVADIEEDQLGALRIDGVHTFPTSVDFDVGDRAYLDETEVEATDDADDGGNPYLGRVTEVGDGTVDVRINFMCDTTEES